MAKVSTTGGYHFAAKSWKVGEGRKRPFGAVPEPEQNERNKIKILLRSTQICAIITVSIRFTGGSYAALP